MPPERSRADRRAEIDEYLARTLESGEGEAIETARSTMDECEDRWYGQLLALSYESMARETDDESVLPAATAIECLRGYCRLRNELLVETGEANRSAARNPTATLLAGDYLYTSAYSALGAIDDARLGACFETLTNVSERITGAFREESVQSPAPPTPRPRFIDGTAGTLGRGAALLGATLAEADPPLRERFAALGSGLAAGRRIQLVLDPDGETGRTAAASPYERRLGLHATRRLEEAERAFRDVSITADADALRTFVGRIGPGSSTDDVSN